jgi:hypothetical protein
MGVASSSTSVWLADLRRGQANNTISIMVKF